MEKEIENQNIEIERLNLLVKNLEEDKQDLLQRLRFYRDRQMAKNDPNLIKRTIRFLGRFKGSQNYSIKVEAEHLLNNWNDRRNQLSTIKKKDYVSK
jgi:hypothetical protein